VAGYAAVWRTVLVGLVGVCLHGAALGASIGSAVVVVNNVTGQTKTEQSGVPMRVGIDVLQDETIRTAEASAARLVFQDNTQFEIGPISDVILDRAIFDPDPSKSEVALSIAKGTARFVTGYLPKTAYRIQSPAASIGIRGTILDISVASNGATSVFVESGSVFVTGGGKTIEVNPGQSTIVLVGGVPSVPVNGTIPSPANQLRLLLKQAALSPNGAKALVAAMLALYPAGGPALTDAVALALEQDPGLAQAFVNAAQSATTAQQLALGAGLGQAAIYFANNGSDANLRQITAAIATAPATVQTVFAEFGVRNINNTVLVTTITGVSNLGTNSCVSPSKPGGRC
jgi:hypothetical protein